MQQLPYIAEIFVLGGIASAAVIAADLRTCRQPMRIMNAVWILTGLWAAFFGLWAYYAFGRVRSCTLEERERRLQKPETKMPGMDMSGTEMRGMEISGKNAGMSGMETRGMDMSGMKTGMPGTETHGMEMPGMKTGMSGTEMPGMDMPGMKTGMSGMETHGMEIHGMNAGMSGTEMHGMETGMSGMSGMDLPGMAMESRPRWQSVVLSTLHCGAGCTLADLIGEWFLYFVPVAVGGSLIAGAWVFDYVLALIFGIGFQYAAIRGMEPESPRAGIVRRAAKADFLSLTAWQAGMYGWMAVVIFALNDGMTLPRTSFDFWFMMQIAMAFGFLAALPVNVLLIRKGIKQGM